MLADADLIGAVLSGAHLKGAPLPWTNMSGAYLNGADLSEADLSGATGWTEKQLTAAESLKGATMPNGQKYED
jgi:uncharacterized protein YjbI with pentapeptide repeats